MASKARPAITLVLGIALLATVAAGQVGADPPDEPDHGVNETTFPLLWSGDEDGSVGSVGDGDNETVAIRQLASGADLPLNAVPGDVERWNGGEMDEFPPTNSTVSIQPGGADTDDGRFVRDAHATIFTVEPSTQARLSSSSQPLYVGSEGTVLGTVDYRVGLPEDDTDGSRRVSWAIEDHHVEETRLLIDSTEVVTGDGSHTPRLSFAELDAGPHDLTIAADVSVRVAEHVRTEREVCEDDDNESTCRTAISHGYSDHEETVTVTDRIDVVGYDLDVSGRQAKYPGGDTALVLTAEEPWLAHSLPDGNVTGTWRLYTARDPDWDRLAYHTANGSSKRHSPLHPLQVNAVPLRIGATASQANGTILETDGERREPPTLPENVNMGVPDEPYTGSETIVTRTSEDVSTLHVRGLVRGVETHVDVDDLDGVEVRRSNLTLSIADASGSDATVIVTLEDESTGAPINTADRDGHVVLAGERVNTTGDGTAAVTLDRPRTAISARYEPGDWWNDAPGFEADSQTITVGGPSLRPVATLYRLTVPAALFLLSAYLIDRITRWQLWPPWRGL